MALKSPMLRFAGHGPGSRPPGNPATSTGEPVCILLVMRRLRGESSDWFPTAVDDGAGRCGRGDRDPRLFRPRVPIRKDVPVELMPLAIFGIGNTALNLAVTIAILVLVAVWLALIVFTFTDARRRISDPFLVGCATAASLFPFIGTVIYTILRPPEFLEDVRERETEIHESEIRLRHLEYNSCHKCGAPAETDFLRCTSCRTRLKQPCPECSRPVGLDWKVCPYCEKTLIAPRRSSRSGSRGGGRPPAGGRSSPRPASPGKSREGPARSSTDARKRSGEERKRSDRPPAGGEKPPRKPETGGEAPAGRRSSRRRRRVVSEPDETRVSGGDGKTVAESGTEPINRGD